MARVARNGGRRIAAMIAGAQKCGTTSLLRYLAQHPSLQGHATVECAYFADDHEYAAGWGRRGLGRYFPPTGPELLVAKNVVLSRDSSYVERLAQHNPDCLVILMLRDPVDRAFSSYRRERNAGAVERPFSHIVSVLDDPSHDWYRLFVEPGHYPRTVERLYDHFPRSQVHILLLKDLRDDAVAVSQEIFRRLGVDPSFEPDTATVHNAQRRARSRAYARTLLWLRQQRNPLKRVAKTVLPSQAFHRVGHALVAANSGVLTEEDMAPEVRTALGAHYAASNAELQRLLGRDLSHWTGMAGTERAAAPL